MTLNTKTGVLAYGTLNLVLVVALALPVACIGTHVCGTAYAADEGHGSSGGHGGTHGGGEEEGGAHEKGGSGKGRGGSDQHRGGGHGGSSALVDKVLRDEGRGSSGGHMGRLNMAHAYLSPGFDPSRIDDAEAPLASLDSYKTALEERGDSVTLAELAAYLSNVATAPINGTSIAKLNDMLGVELPASVQADDLASEVNRLVKESREDEEGSH